MKGSHHSLFKTLVALVGGVVLGLLLGLAIGWWWWPVEWTNTTPGNLRSDFQSNYVPWVAERYATTGDLEDAISKLGVEYWKEGQLAETLERLTRERGGEEAAHLQALAQALEATSEAVPAVPAPSVWEMRRPVVRVCLVIVSAMAFMGGGAFLLVRHLRRLRAASEAAAQATRIARGIPPSKRVSWGGEGLPLVRSMRGLRRFLFNWQNLLALAIVGFFVFVAVAAPWLAPPDDPDNPTPFRRVVAGDTLAAQTTSRQIPLPPSRDLPLGTVPGGLDVFYSVVWGARSALRFGLIITLTTAVFGILVGAISGYFGGLLNRLVMRITDAFLTFPAIAGIFLFREIMRPVSPEALPTALQRAFLTLKLDPVMLALILFSWMPYARIINANIARLKQEEYALAAKTVGASRLRIILRHLLPNGIAPAIVLAARDVGGMVILEAAFTFIGVGGGSPWGVLLVRGRDWIIGPGGNPLTYWWVFLPATLALILFGIGWNLLGDGLNTALNPRMAHRRLW